MKRIWANTELIYNANPATGENSGIYDDTQPADSSYNHFLPPSPLAEYTTARYNGDATPDGNGIIHVTSTAGNYASITIYPGNDTQTIDPVIQADVDAKRGAGNTPLTGDGVTRCSKSTTCQNSAESSRISLSRSSTKR